MLTNIPLIYSLEKDVNKRPYYVDLLKHPFIVRYSDTTIDVSAFVSDILSAFPENGEDADANQVA